MKIIGIEDENENKKNKKGNIGAKIESLKTGKNINKKKVLIASIVLLIILIFIILIAVYAGNKSFRDVIDKYVLMKNVVEDSTTSIDLNEDESSNVFAYDKYICVLSKNTLKNYNSSGKIEGQLNIEITSPIIATNGKFVLIGEKDKSKLYLVSGNEIIWQKELEGNIDKMTVNKNGYVAVILSGTTYKSVIETYDATGTKLFKTYLRSTIAMDADISLDNQYLAFTEINTSGTAIQSTVKIISIQNATQKDSEKSSADDPIIYKYVEPNGNWITNIKYQEGNRLVCMYDNGIYVIKNENNELLVSLVEDGKKISFGDIELNNYVFRVIEKSSILSSETTVEIINSSNKKTSIYTIDSVPREVYSYNNIIAVNLGSEVHFISTNGWLIKKYISNQEVKKIVINNNFAGIVYRNKIEIVNM